MIDDATPATDVMALIGASEGSPVWKAPEPRRRLSDIPTDEVIAELERRGLIVRVEVAEEPIAPPTPRRRRGGEARPAF